MGGRLVMPGQDEVPQPGGRLVHPDQDPNSTGQLVMPGQAPPSTSAPILHWLNEPLIPKPQDEFRDLTRPQAPVTPAPLSTAEKVSRGVSGAIGDTLRGLSSPLNLGLLVGTSFFGGIEGAAAKVASRLMSLGFSVNMLEGAYDHSQAVRDAMDRGDTEAATYHITHAVLGVGFAGVAGLHAAGKMGVPKPVDTTDLAEGEPAARQGEPLSQAEHMYVQAAVQANLEHGLSSGNQPHVDDTIAAQREFTNATNAGLANGPVQQVSQPAPAQQGQPTGLEPGPGAEGARSLDAQVGREETIRPGSRAARGEGTPGPDSFASPFSQANGGPSGPGEPPEPTAVLGSIAAMHEAITGEPLNLAQPAGELGNGSVMDRPPAISRLADRDLANGGITVIRPGKDLSNTARYLGSLTQQAARLGNPFFQSIANKIADAVIGIARNTRDSITDFRANTRSIVSPQEWKDRVVPLLNSPDVSPESLDPALPQNIKTAYLNERARLDNDRLEIISAQRRALIASGMTPAAAQTAVPDDWGIQQGYYPHAFPGNWTIVRLAAEANEDEPAIYEPIDTGWRQITLAAAQAKAKEYLAANPDAELRVGLDNATLPGRDISDRARLHGLLDSVKLASELIYNGENPDGILKDLKDKAQAAAYGPRRVAKRQNSAILQRDANLPGWADDIDNYERYIVGIERYKVLAPARQELMGLRNKLASMTGMPEIQRINEMPRRYSNQYANMLGRTDASIEALEGYPTGLDAAIRNKLQQLGYDPNMVDRAYLFINSAEALLKLGFNPASAGLHMAQTLAATYPVLGEKYTWHGLTHAYSSDYGELVHDLGIESTSSMLDIDSFRAYRGGYLSRDTSLGNLSAGGYKALQDTGLYMFSKGVETARRIAAIGAYQKALDQGMSAEGARNYARDQLIRTQFLYTPADAPIALRMLPKPIQQFRNFGLKMGEFVTGLRGAEVPRFLVAMGLIGYSGMIGLTALSTAIEKFTGYNPEDELKKAFPRASRGVLGMLGIDYTKNIGFADWLGPRSFDLDRLTGPAGSDLLNIGKASLAELQQKFGKPTRSGQQDIDTSLRNISPEARRIWDEAHRVATGDTSLLDPRSGAVIAKNLTLAERLELLGGFTPIRVAEERDTHDRVRKEIESAKDQRGYFIDKLAGLQVELMRQDLNEQQRNSLMQESTQVSKLAEQYGQAHLLGPAVVQRAKELLRERWQRDYKGAPRSVRPQIQQEQEGSH